MHQHLHDLCRNAHDSNTAYRLRRINICKHQLLLQAGDAANQADVKFELWRKVKGDVFERWEEQTCSLNPAKPPESVSIESEGGTVVNGLRHRLQVHAALLRQYVVDPDLRFQTVLKEMLAGQDL